MAAVIGDFVSDPSSHFHNMIAAGSALSHQHSRDSSYRSTSCSGDSAAPRRPSASPRYQQQRSQDWAASEPPEKRTAGSGASRFPTPPSSSSPNHAAAARVCSHNAKGDDDLMASQAPDAARTGSATVDGPSTGAAQQQQPSPASDTTADTAYHLADASSPRVRPQGQTIRIRDLAHIQNLARADVLKGEGSGILNESSSPQIKYEISGMPIGDVIEMVAALLTKITTTNDLQHDAMQRNVAHQQQASQNSESGNGPQMSPLSTSVLAFHGKNIPAITILSYLSRIHKYCPTTYEVFLSLLVYFDRMTERVNDLIVKTEGRRQTSSDGPKAPSAPPAPANDVEMHDEESDEADETDSDLADDDDDDDEDMVDSAPRNGAGQAPRNGGSVIPGSDPVPSVSPAAYFVVDSFNIHRLIIAGVTCASKFFSDVFYTNSRYAKVGGLPLAELNHLELQFLLLNDFRLAVPVEDLEAYGTMLVEFYAREVVRPQARSAPADA